jgi:hypothetical protein
MKNLTKKPSAKHGNQTCNFRIKIKSQIQKNKYAKQAE